MVEVERFMSMDSLVEPDSSVFSGMLKYLAQRTLHCLGLIRGKHEPRAFPNMIHNEGVEVLDKLCVMQPKLLFEVSKLKDGGVSVGSHN